MNGDSTLEAFDGREREELSFQGVLDEKLRYLPFDDLAYVEEGTPTRRTLELLTKNGSRGAVLIVRRVEGGLRVVGIFTERDYLDKLSREGVDHDRPIDEVMTADPRVVSPEDTIDQAIMWMIRGGYRHLPVVDGAGILVGLVSTTDIIAYLAEFFPVEVYNLPPRLHQDERISTREGG